MKSNFNQRIFDNFREEIQKRFGEKIVYDKDCRLLAEHIFRSVNRRISVSTLKRLWKIINYPFNPSSYTLDTLAIYSGYENWADYWQKKNNSENLPSAADPWGQLKESFRSISESSLISMKGSSVFNKIQLPDRDFAGKILTDFLHSPKIATALIAPSGYGKTEAIIQLVEKYFTGPEALYPDDIVCLIDGKIFSKIIIQHIEIGMLGNLIEFFPEKSFSVYFRDNPGQVRGRVIMIIDGVNEIYHQPEKLNGFIMNLMKIISSYEGITWYKLIITCRPETWKYFSLHFIKNPNIKNLWFNVFYEINYLKSSNIPLLEDTEIQKTLELNEYPETFEKIRFKNPEITRIINHLYFLNLFISGKKKRKLTSSVDLMYYFISEKVFNDAFSDQKYEILDSFFQHCEMGRRSNYVKKDELRDLKKNDMGYRELISEGILQEYVITGNYLKLETYIHFTHNILYEFFLANKWLEKNNLDLELLKNIILFYEDEEILRTNILAWLIKIAFKEENTGLLMEIFSIFDYLIKPGESLKPDNPVSELLNTIGVQLRRDRNLRNILIPHYAKIKTARSFYFEKFIDLDSLVLHYGDSVNYFLEQDKSPGGHITGHFLKFMQYFLSRNTGKCEEEYLYMTGFELPSGLNPLQTAFYFSVPVIYQTVFHDRLDKNLFLKMLDYSDTFASRVLPPDDSILPLFELCTIFSLNFGDRFKEIVELGNRVLSGYQLTNFESTWHYQLFIAFLARACLHTGEIQRALELFSQVEDIKNIPVNCYNYVFIRHSLVKTEFLIFEKKLDEAKALIGKTKILSEMLGFDLYEKTLARLEMQIRDQLPVKRQNFSENRLY